MNHLFKKLCQKFQAQLIEFDGEHDHVHLLIHYPPIAISTLVNSPKDVSSGIRQKQFVRIRKFYWKGLLCSSSYVAISCGGAPISGIKQYIAAQQTPIK